MRFFRSLLSTMSQTPPIALSTSPDPSPINSPINSRAPIPSPRTPQPPSPSTFFHPYSTYDNPPLYIPIMSTTSSTTLSLRYTTILLSLPSAILISVLTTLPTTQHRLCLLLCLPLAASSIVNCYVLWKTRQQQRNARTCPLDVALVLALDVIMGSVLLLTAVAGWFIVRAELMVEVQAGRAASAEEHAYGRWAVAPLVLGFCIHYFLAFASLETGMFVQPVLAYALEHRVYTDQDTPLIPLGAMEIDEKRALALENESPV